jgi:hypothetical protein
MIVSFGFRARSGKDEAGKYLQKHFGFTQAAFADKLKQAVMLIFELSREQVYGDLKEIIDPRWNDTPRNILQKMGTECMRNGYAKDIWVRALEMRIRREGIHNDWCMTDVRFVEEAEAVQLWGGFVVQVVRPNAPGIATAQHASEISMRRWNGWDYTLDNSGDLPQLYANIEVMMRIFRARVDFAECQPMKDPVKPGAFQ